MHKISLTNVFFHSFDPLISLLQRTGAGDIVGEQRHRTLQIVGEKKVQIQRGVKIAASGGNLGRLTKERSKSGEVCGQKYCGAALPSERKGGEVQPLCGTSQLAARSGKLDRARSQRCKFG